MSLPARSKEPLQHSQTCEVKRCLTAELEQRAKLFRYIAIRIGRMKDIDTSDAHPLRGCCARVSRTLHCGPGLVMSGRARAAFLTFFTLFFRVRSPGTFSHSGFRSFLPAGQFSRSRSSAFASRQTSFWASDVVRTPSRLVSYSLR